EIEWVFDLVRNAGGELTQRGQLLCLHQAVLRGTQIFKGGPEFAGSCLHALEQAHILDRDHRLIGKNADKIDLLLRKGLDHRPRQKHGANRNTFAHEWNTERSAKTANLLCVKQNKFGVGENVRHMDDFALQGSTTAHRAALDLQVQSLHIFEKIRRETILRDVFNGVVSQERNIPFFRPANAHRRLDQRIEHCAQIKSRSADNLEHLRCRGLLLERFRKLARACLHLVKQSHVLNRDHRLVCERLDERNLLLRERLDLQAISQNYTEQLIALEHRHRKHSPDWIDRLRSIRVFRISHYVGNVSGAAFKCSTARCAAATRPDGVLPHKFRELARCVVSHYWVKQFAIETKNESLVGLAKAYRTFSDGLKNRLQIERRAANDIEHVSRGSLLLEGFAQFVE